MRKMKRRVEMFRAGHVPPGTQTRQLVDDLWQEYERAVKRLRKISVRARRGLLLLPLRRSLERGREGTPRPRLRVRRDRALERTAPTLFPRGA